MPTVSGVFPGSGMLSCAGLPVSAVLHGRLSAVEILFQRHTVGGSPFIQTVCQLKQVREMFNVCDTPLNLWAKRGYLVPVKFGNKNMYTKTDIDRIRTGSRAETVSAYCRKKKL